MQLYSCEIYFQGEMISAPSVPYPRKDLIQYREMSIATWMLSAENTYEKLIS